MLDMPRPDAAATPFDPTALLGDLAASDPRLAQLLQLMQPRTAAKAEAADGQAERDRQIAELTDQLAAIEDRLAKVTRVAKRLHEAERASATRLAELAAALGACGLCWGEDETCPCCRGRGRPGMVRPDPDLRARLLGTAVRPAGPCTPADTP